MTHPRILQTGARGGALFLIATFMIISAVVRLGAEAGPALSKVVTDAANSSRTPTEKHAPDATVLPTEIGPLLAAMQAREAGIAKKEREIDDRLQALRIAEAAIEDRIKALKAAEDRLRTTLAVADGASENDLAKLTSVYEQMKAKETAALFEEMAPEFAAGFLARMRPEVAAAVLEGMNPRAAYTVSVILASRNLQVPTQ